MEGVHNGIGETYHLPLFFQNYLLKLGVKLVTCDFSAPNQTIVKSSFYFKSGCDPGNWISGLLPDSKY